jgi:hypothetical protein
MVLDTVRSPRLSLSSAEAHTIQDRGDLRVRPGARHLSNDRTGFFRVPLPMFAGLRFWRAQF